MKITKTDYRQLVDDVRQIGSLKDFRGTFIDGLKAAATLKDIDKILEGKRYSYNQALTECLRRYGIEPYDLWGKLDEYWDKAKRGTYRKVIEDQPGVYYKIIRPVLLTEWFAGLFGFGILTAHLVEFQIKVKDLWEKYKNKSKEYIESYAKDLIGEDPNG